MTPDFVLRTPPGPVRFRVNEEAREDEPVLVRDDDMNDGLLLFALVDARLEALLRIGRLMHDNLTPCPTCDECRDRLGQWRAQWWGTR